MRLFIAINFSDNNKNLLHHTASCLKQQLGKAHLGEAANYHLTLAFLGESEERERALRAMEKAVLHCHPFCLITMGAGRFRRPGGDVCWLGVEKSKELLLLQKKLATELQLENFVLENRPYHPHLTLLREAAVPGDYNWQNFNKTIAPICQPVEAITLMQSQRIKGKLIYSPLETTRLV
ncbi:MAG: RNA 2',3'-cyclic phosphodiesterase [Clostridiales bacterium]